LTAFFHRKYFAALIKNKNKKTMLIERQNYNAKRKMIGEVKKIVTEKALSDRAAPH
jgi:hypothetical protein